MTSPVALITGGAIRIGRDICKKFHENGYDIVCHFNKSETAANELKSELNEIRADSLKIIIHKKTCKIDLGFIQKNTSRAKYLFLPVQFRVPIHQCVFCAII